MNKILLSLFAVLFATASFWAQETSIFNYDINKQNFIELNNSEELIFKDNKILPVKTGMPIVFNKNKYDYIYVSNNGWLSYSKDAKIKNFIDEGLSNSIISPLCFFKNNIPTEVYKVFVKRNNNNIVIQWENKKLSFQAFLFSDGLIDFRYKIEESKVNKQKIKQTGNYFFGVYSNIEAVGHFPFNLSTSKYSKVSPYVILDNKFSNFIDDNIIINETDKTTYRSQDLEQNSKFIKESKTTDNFTTPGSDTWTCPAGVTSVTIHCIGGGGGGGGTRSNYKYGGGGGAGGSYATKVITVTPGNTYNLYVGDGGAGGSNGNGIDGEASWFNNTSEVYAVGGAGGAEPNGGTANGGLGTTTGCIGTTVYAGGNAGNGTGSGGISGGGGGGAGTTGAGGNASGRIGGTGTSPGGDGGNGRSNNEGNGRVGLDYGGGGSGAFVKDLTNHAGGAGAGGAIQIMYSTSASALDGTFESGTSFAANGMTEINDATNYWIVGTATDNGGVNSAYITTDGTSNGYDNTVSQVSHFYFDYDFPAGATSIDLDFDWKCDGESSFDNMRVFLVPTTTTPVAGTSLSSGQLNSVNYSEQTTWQSTTISINTSNAGTTQRLVFSWKNDGSLGGDPPIAIDNIEITSVIPVACSTPTDQPTALSLTPSGSNQIDGSFSAASSSPDEYLVVYSTNPTLSADPTDGTTYSAGDALGGGTVLQVSNSTTFSHTCIAPNTTFYYYIFSVNSACTGGPLYLCSSSTPSVAPLTGNATTGVASADETLPYTQNFDTNDGWTYGAGGIWARGNQTDDANGPPSGHSGNTVAGTNLNAEYGTNVDDYLVTPSFDLSGTSGPIVDFWMDMESESGLDGGTVQIQVNGCSWVTVDMNDPGYSGLVPNDTDVDGMQDAEDGWSGTQPAGEWDEVKIDLFALTTSGLSNIQTGDIVKVRFWFGSDGSVAYPGWYIDDYAIYDPPPCTEPTAQPTNLSLTPGYTTIDGTFTAASPVADEYLVVVSTDPTLSAGDLPIDGTNYGVGNSIGDGTVVMSSSGTSFTATGLTMGTTYYFFIFSYNTTACAGRNYLTTNPLTGNETTYDCSSGTVPYHEDFDAVSTPDLPSCWTIEDNSAPDDDWVSYAYNSYSSPQDMHISYDGSNPLDDWAFSPGLILTGGTTYTIEFYYKAGGSSYTEKLEVYYGSGQSSGNMSTQLFQDNGFSHTDYILVSENFTPGSNGTYYFGWHAYSATDQLGIYVDDIFIYEPGPPTITSLSSNYLYKDKGKQITITGTNLGSPTSVDIGGIAGTVVSSNYNEAIITFPAGTYPNGTLTYTTAFGSTTTTVDVRIRNIIPVDASAATDADEHQTITSAVDGLYAWYGNTAFNAGDLPGAKTIQVMTGTYAEMVVPNTNLNPVAGAGLSIEAKAGQQPVVNASGLNYGFDVDLDYTIIKGFTVNNADNDNIRSQGNNCVISYNECIKASLAGIRAYNNTIIEHNLLHENTSYGIYLENATNAQLTQNTTYKNGGSQGAAGYTRTVDLGSGSIYNWEYNTSWTQIPSVDDDTYIVDFGSGNNFPFDFSFWGTQYVASDVLGISSNGILNLGTDYNITYVNYPLSEDGYTNDNTLNCFWDDMDADDYTSDGKIQYVVRGSAPYRRLIVVWYHRTHYRHRGDAGADNTDYIAVEAKIFETTGVIEYHYYDLVFDTDGDITEDYDWASSATIGIKKDGLNYDEYHYSSEDDLPQVDVNHGLQGGAIRYTPNPTNGTELYIASGSNIKFENNIMRSIDDGGTSPFYVIQAPSGVFTAFNYNDVYKGTNTNLAKIGGTDYANLASWGIGGSGNIEIDPKFVDVANTDFHIKSSALGASFHDGEWPPLTAGAGVWTADNDISPNVDTGDPAATYDLEQPDNGSRLNIGVYGNTLQATKTAVLVGIWTGAVDTVWNVPNNWSDAVVPTGSCVSGSGTNATIPDISTASGNFPYISNIAEVEDLTIDANAYLTILPNAGLTVCGTLTNNNGNAGLILNSDATGDGSLIHSTSSIPATVYRFLRGTQFHYISSPIASANTAAIGIQGGTYGVQFYAWDASMQWNGMGASPPATIDYAPWNPSNPVSGVLNIGQGYAYFYTESTLNFVGNLNVTDQNINLKMNSGGAPDDQGWNLIGNPFASALDWDLVTKPPQSEMESAIYFFKDDDGTGSRANYQYYVPSGGSGGAYSVGTSGATKDIPVGQSFFVKTLQDNLNLTLSAGARIHSSQSFYKKENENLLRVTINSTENNFKDEMIVRFITDGNPDFDALFDARKIFPADPEIPQLFSISTDQKKLAINSMPNLTKSYEIPLGFVCLSGNYSININEYNFEEKKVRIYLQDDKLQKIVELKNNYSYTFVHSGGFNINRFKLYFVVNTAPYVNVPIENQFIKTNDEYLFTIKDNVFIDDDFADKLQYSAKLSSGELLPAGLIFDNKNKTFYWKEPIEGKYEIEVTATDLNGLLVSDIFSLTVEGVSINIYHNSNSEISIFPNPSSGIFSISSEYPIYNINIIDITGRHVYTNKLQQNKKIKINISKIPKGIYTIKLNTSNGVFIKKITLK